MKLNKKLLHIYLSFVFLLCSGKNYIYQDIEIEYPPLVEISNTIADSNLAYNLKNKLIDLTAEFELMIDDILCEDKATIYCCYNKQFESVMSRNERVEKILHYYDLFIISLIKEKKYNQNHVDSVFYLTKSCEGFDVK